MHHLTKRVKAHYADSTETRDWAIRQPHVGLPRARRARASPTPRRCCREINGYDVADRRAGAAASRELDADGSTACGCWIYSGVYADGVNQARRRDPGDATRRAAASRPSGRGRGRRTAACSTTAPPPTRRAGRGRSARSTSGGTRTQGKWTGYDVPDFPVDKRPDYRAPDDAEGMDAIGGDDPFMMMADGRAWLYSPRGLLDGPLPTHYEPLESPVDNLLYPEVGANPAAHPLGAAGQPVHAPGDPRYPIVATTFRLTEHHTAGAMSRHLPWLAELQPEMFAEIDPVLAAERGIEDGGWMVDLDRARRRSRRARG